VVGHAALEEEAEAQTLRGRLTAVPASTTTLTLCYYVAALGPRCCIAPLRLAR
jgi:hypothetical protein